MSMEKHVVHDYVMTMTLDMRPRSLGSYELLGFLRSAPCPRTVQPSVELWYYWPKRATYESSPQVKFYTMTSCANIWARNRNPPTEKRENLAVTPPSSHVTPVSPLQQANRNLHTSLCLSHVTQFEIATCRLNQHSTGICDGVPDCQCYFGP